MSEDIPTLRRILAENSSIAVVGLSAKWHRPSYFAAKYLKDHGYRILPVNPAYDEVLGERCYASLAQIPEPGVEPTREGDIARASCAGGRR